MSAAAATMPEELKYLSEKRVALSNPGTKMNDLYYSRLNSTVQNVEITYTQGRFRQSLTSPTFGGTSTVTVPNDTFLGESYLHLELPNLPPNVSICRGWGYALIREIGYLFGSSNVSQMKMTGQSAFHVIMNQCQTEEKRSEILRRGGDAHVQPLVAPSGEDVPLLTADVILPLPWSGSCGDKLEFDTNTLHNPITITITFNDARSIFGGSGTIPTSLNSASMSFRQGMLTNKNLSLSHELNRNPMLLLSYPFIHHQPFQTPRFTGKRRSEGVASVSLQLQSFINADLVGISIGVIEAGKLQGDANKSPSPFNYDKIENFSLQFNGQTLYESQYDSWRLYNCQSLMGCSSYANDVIEAGGVSPFASRASQDYIITVDFSRMRSLCFDKTYFNTHRIQNQTLSVSFNTKKSVEYYMYTTYHYNAVAEIQNGETSLVFT